MKKSYISPKARLVNLEDATIMAGSTPIVGGDGPVPDGDGNGNPISGMAKRRSIGDIAWFEDEEY